MEDEGSHRVLGSGPASSQSEPGLESVVPLLSAVRVSRAPSRFDLLRVLEADLFSNHTALQVMLGGTASWMPPQVAPVFSGLRANSENPSSGIRFMSCSLMASQGRKITQGQLGAILYQNICVPQQAYFSNLFCIALSAGTVSLGADDVLEAHPLTTGSRRPETGSICASLP